MSILFPSELEANAGNSFETSSTTTTTIPSPPPPTSVTIIKNPQQSSTSSSTTRPGSSVSCYSTSSSSTSAYSTTAYNQSTIPFDPYEIIAQHIQTKKATNSTPLSSGVCFEFTRKEIDSLGEIDVPTNAFWSTSTQRCLEHFGIKDEYDFIKSEYHSSHAFILCILLIKKAAIIAHLSHSVLPIYKGKSMLYAIEMLMQNSNNILYEQFPLPLIQTGSLTHLNMNINEVVTNYANSFIIDCVLFYHLRHQPQPNELGSIEHDSIITNQPLQTKIPLTNDYSSFLTHLYDILPVKQISHLNYILHSTSSLPSSINQTTSTTAQHTSNNDNNNTNNQNISNVDNQHQYHQSSNTIWDKSISALDRGLYNTDHDYHHDDTTTNNNNIDQNDPNHQQSSSTSSTSSSNMNTDSPILHHPQHQQQQKLQSYHHQRQCEHDTVELPTRLYSLPQFIWNSIQIIDSNDDCNCGQSSNDVIPTAIRILTIFSMRQVKQACEFLLSSLLQLAQQNNCHENVIKLARTHLQAATPIKLYDELMAFYYSLKHIRERLEILLFPLFILPIGGTACSTGLNTYIGFDNDMVTILSNLTDFKFQSTTISKSELMSCCNDEIMLHGGLTTLSSWLAKFAQDIRLLSMPGIDEYHLKQLESGSSIMPNKSNPTQIEALLFTCSKVNSNHSMIINANLFSQLQFSAMRPTLLYSLQDSCELLSHSISTFNTHCINHLTFNYNVMSTSVMKSPMLATSLTPIFGYQYVSKLVHKCIENNISLEQGLINDGKIENHQQFMKMVNINKMITPLKLNEFLLQRRSKIIKFEDDLNFFDTSILNKDNNQQHQQFQQQSSLTLLRPKSAIESGFRSALFDSDNDSDNDQQSSPTIFHPTRQNNNNNNNNNNIKIDNQHQTPFDNQHHPHHIPSNTQIASLSLDPQLDTNPDLQQDNIINNIDQTARPLFTQNQLPLESANQDLNNNMNNVTNQDINNNVNNNNNNNIDFLDSTLLSPFVHRPHPNKERLDLFHRAEKQRLIDELEESKCSQQQNFDDECKSPLQ